MASTGHNGFPVSSIVASIRTDMKSCCNRGLISQGAKCSTCHKASIGLDQHIVIVSGNEPMPTYTKPLEDSPHRNGITPYCFIVAINRPSSVQKLTLANPRPLKKTKASRPSERTPPSNTQSQESPDEPDDPTPARPAPQCEPDTRSAPPPAALHLSNPLAPNA